MQPFTLRYHRFTALLLALTLLAGGITPAVAQTAQTGMIGTDTLVSELRADQQRSEVQAFLGRDDVREQLTDWGVDPAEAEQRVASMTDREVADLHQQIEDLPAGAGLGTVVGAAVFVFVVLLVTDILGFTDVFPFVTRTVQ